MAYIGKDENGKRKYKSFTASTRKQAEFLAADFVANNQDKDICELTVADAVSGYIASKENVLSPSTIEGYRNIERNRLGALANVTLDDLDSRRLQKYINMLSVNISPKSVRNAYGLIMSAISLYLPDKRIIVTLPAKRNIVRDLPTAQEVVNSVKGKNVELPTLLAMWLSLRMSEIRGIQYRDITRGILTVRRTVLTVRGEHIVRDQTKTYGSTRRLTLPPYIRNLIGSGQPNDFIIPDSAEVIYKRFVSCIKDAGLPHMRFHDLRHLSASIMVGLGIPDKYSMERGGWTTSSTLQNVYQHTFSAERAEVDVKIDTYFETLLG